MIKEKIERRDLSLDKLSDVLKNPPQDVFVSVYTKKRVEVEPVGHSKDKLTLKQVVEMMNEGFKRLDSKMDAGFKQINARIDNIEKRLDYNGLQIVEINKRLDYNNLKPLPKENR